MMGKHKDIIEQPQTWEKPLTRWYNTLLDDIYAGTVGENTVQE